MTQGGNRNRPDPRSPVQPGGSTNPLAWLILVLLLGAAWWTYQQERVARDQPESSGSSGDAPPNSTLPKGTLAGLIRADDYPEEALIREEQGTVGVQLTVNRRGRVSECAVRQSSGSRSLDTTTCRILQSRARFEPARNAAGEPGESTVTQRITWRLE